MKPTLRSELRRLIQTERMILAETLLDWAMRVASPTHPDTLVLVQCIDRYLTISLTRKAERAPGK